MAVHPSELISRLHLHPGDTAVLFGYAERRRRDRIVVEGVFGVVHRKREAFTHVYRVPFAPASGRTDVYLEKVICGERLPEARYWASTVFPVSLPFDFFRGVGKRQEPVLVQAFRPETTVERFDVGVVRRLPWS